MITTGGTTNDQAIHLDDMEPDDRKDGHHGQQDDQELVSLFPKALHGVLFALSSDGDIIYTADNVNQQLGLAQVHYSFHCG